MTRTTLLTLLLAIAWLLGGAGLPARATGRIIRLVSTDRSRYSPGESVTVRVDLENRTGFAFTGSLRVGFRFLGRPVEADRNYPVPELLPGATDTVIFTWAPPARDFRGYLLDVSALDATGAAVEDATAAVDVSSDWKRFPRYGFLSAFDAGLDTAARVAAMRDFSINGIQFYDWQWQHHRPYSPDAQWPDIANRTVDRATVEGLIDAAHKNGMVAMAYNLLNGAYDNYWSDGSGVQLAWGLFKDGDGGYDPSRQDSHCCLPASWATQRIYLFDPLNPGWRDYLFGREREMFSHFAFDGYHIDSLGYRGGLWTWEKKPVDLAETFAPFANAAKSALDRRVIFNSVGTYGQDQVASGADVDAVYSELWDDTATDDYADIRDVVERAQARTDKAVILAAYMNYDYARATPDRQTRPFNEASVRLTNAAIFASGGSHIELGDGAQMLSNEYFPSHKLVMGEGLRAAVRDEYTFLTAYENLLRDGVRRGAFRAEVEGIPSSPDGGAGQVWTLARSRPGFDILHLINLRRSASTKWRDTNAACPTPDTLTDLPVKVYTDGTIPEPEKAWFASPDVDGGTARALPLTRGSDAGGRFVRFIVPGLTYWSMVWLEKAPPRGGELLFRDFEDVPAGTLPADWTPLSGTWAVRQPEGRTREMQVEGGGVLRYGPGFDEGDYTVEARVHVNSTTGNAAVLARVQQDGGFYQLEIKSGTTWALYKHDGKATWREIVSGPFPYAADSDHVLRLTVRRNSLTAEVDGQGKGTYTDYDRPYYFGSVGLRSESQPVRFDNVRVTAPLPPYIRALRLAGGLASSDATEAAGLDIVPSPDGARVDMRDALELLRRLRW